MMSRLRSLLHKLVADERFCKVASEAIELVNSFGKPIDLGAAGEPQSAQSVAELWAFRQRIGYYKPSLLIGVDETIAALREVGGDVSLTVADLQGASIAIWADLSGAPLGVLVARRAPPSEQCSIDS